jgi:hypothetical protein
MEVQTNAVDNVLVVTIAGQIDVKEALAIGRQLFERQAGEGMRGILIDCRAVLGEIGTVDRYDLGVAAAELQRAYQPADKRAARIAIVAVPPLFDVRRMMETVATNRGAALHTFTSLADAAEWLQLDVSLLQDV